MAREGEVALRQQDSPRLGSARRIPCRLNVTSTAPPHLCPSLTHLIASEREKKPGLFRSLTRELRNELPAM